MNPIAPLRVTLIIHEKYKENDQNNCFDVNSFSGAPRIIPVQNKNLLKRMATPLCNYSKNQPYVVGRPIDKGPVISETQKIINKLRELKNNLKSINFTYWKILMNFSPF